MSLSSKVPGVPGASLNSNVNVIAVASFLSPVLMLPASWSEAVMVTVGEAVSELTVYVDGDDATLLFPAASVYLLVPTPTVIALPLLALQVRVYDVPGVEPEREPPQLDDLVISPMAKPLVLSLSAKVNVTVVASL
jgi:hypothetical protein